MKANVTPLLWLTILNGCAQPVERLDPEPGISSTSGENEDLVAESRSLWMLENRMTDIVFDQTYRHVVKDYGDGVCIEWYIFNGDLGGDGVYCFDKATRQLRFQRLGE